MWGLTCTAFLFFTRRTVWGRLAPGPLRWNAIRRGRASGGPPPGRGRTWKDSRRNQKKERAYVYSDHVYPGDCLYCLVQRGPDQGLEQAGGPAPGGGGRPGARHGGQFVLEWEGPRAQGAADSEFGPLLVEIPKKLGSGSARFYERGLVLGSKRVSYDNLKDVAFIPGCGGGFTPKQKMRNSSVLWLYRKKGSTIGVRDLSYRFDKQTMEAIQTGLGFRPQV